MFFVSLEMEHNGLLLVSFGFCCRSLRLQGNPLRGPYVPGWGGVFVLSQSQKRKSMKHCYSCSTQLPDCAEEVAVAGVLVVWDQRKVKEKVAMGPKSSKTSMSPAELFLKGLETTS